MTRLGGYAPVATPYAIRCVIARVLPVPAPARRQTGPSSVSAATRCSGSRPARRSSAVTGPPPRSVPRDASRSVEGSAVPLLDDRTSDGRSARDPDGPRAVREVLPAEPAEVDQLDAVRHRLDSVRGVDGGAEADHDRRGERPRLRADVERVNDGESRLLLDLAHHGSLERLARLDEAGEDRVPLTTPQRVGPEQQPVLLVGHADDDRGVGAREHVVSAGLLRLPLGVAPPAALRREGGRTGAGREAVRRVPVGDGERLGEETRVE